MTNPKFSLLAELTAEFLGTFVLILLGRAWSPWLCCFPPTTPGEMIHGGYTNITLGWGLGVTMGIYVAGKDFRGAPESCRHSGAGGFPRISLAESFALLDRANCRSIRRGGAGVPKLSACIPPGGPASGENGGRLHHLPGVSQLAAGGISGPGDRHRVAAAVWSSPSPMNSTCLREPTWRR